MLDGATEFYGSCVLWQCERHRKERPRFLWCSCCCGPEEIRTHTHGCTRRHEQTITTQTRAACANAPSLSASPADRLPRGLALINSPARPHLRLLSHILVCSLLNNFHSPVQLRVFKLASLVGHWMLLVSNRQIIAAQVISELFGLVILVTLPYAASCRCREESSLFYQWFIMCTCERKALPSEISKELPGQCICCAFLGETDAESVSVIFWVWACVCVSADVSPSIWWCPSNPHSDVSWIWSLRLKSPGIHRL